MNMEMLRKAKAELDQKIEEARLQEGAQLMRTMLRDLEFYQFTLDDLTQFAASEKGMRSEEETGPVGLIDSDVKLGAVAMHMLNGDKAATMTSLEDEMATEDHRKDHRKDDRGAGSATLSMTDETSSRPTNRPRPHRCPPLQLRSLLLAKAGRRR